MNQTEIYERYAGSLPPVHPEDHTWVNVHDGHSVDTQALEAVLLRHITGNHALVLVHSEPGIGAELPLTEVASFISPHVLRAELQVTDSAFRSFVAISRSGVATGWTEPTE